MPSPCRVVLDLEAQRTIRSFVRILLTEGNSNTINTVMIATTTINSEHFHAANAALDMVTPRNFLHYSRLHAKKSREK